MKSLILGTLLVLSSYANASILCLTPRMNKVFEIKDSKVTFFNEFDSHAKRELASVNSFSQNLAAGFTKTLDFENQKHIIHIADSKNFSDLNDYLIIRAKNGHEVIYPLSCQTK